MSHQVADEAEVGDGEQGRADIEGDAVEGRHIHHHKVHVDGAHHQDDQTSADLPHAANTTPTVIQRRSQNTAEYSTD